MIRHLTIAALRNMAANRLLSAISILGLSAGIAAAILMGLVIRNQMSFDHFIPSYARTYRLFYPIEKDVPCALSAGHCEMPAGTIPAMRLRYPEIETIARIDKADPVQIQQGNVTGGESFYWADPDSFSVLPLPVLHGTLQGALSHPDDIVLAGAVARKDFGRDDVVGQTLKVAGYPMTIRRFAYHVEFHAWLFAVASAAALLVALLTVAGQAFLVARQKPALALRYE